jgi:sarcosine oxidase subunit alpha
MTAGEKHGIAPVGLEALSLLRAEKGHFIVGYETDGTVAPGDLGLDWLLSKKKPDYIGLRSLSRPDTAREGRKQLVGLLTEDPGEVLADGGQIVAELRERPPMPMIGHVTSTFFSPTLGRSIALALLDGGAARHGETVRVNYAHKTVRATVTSPHFHDPEGERLND